MKQKIDFRSPITALMLCAATFAAVMLVPAGSLASQGDGLRTEERAATAEERAQERATRAQEREARQTARREEREARQNARKSRRESSGEEDAGTPSAGETGAGTPPAGPSARPSNKTDRGCSPTIQASSTHITAGETVTLSGTLGCPTGTSTTEQAPNNSADQPVTIPGQPITIYQHQIGAGAQSFAAIGAPTPEVDGSFTLTSPALNTNTVFKVREGRHAARVIVEVAPLVTLAISTPDASTSSDSTIPKHPRVTFTGTVNPVNTGALVALQVASAGAGEQWRPVAFGRVAADGSYSIAHTFRIPGQVSIRAVVQRKRSNVVGVSEVLSYTASQPQNPRLTIQTSTDPVSYGQQVTISGVAAAATNEPVKLLARTTGSYAVVAETNTDAEDNYTFTQTPLQNTSYMVSDATTRSTVLVEDIGFALTPATTPSTVQVGEQLTFSGTIAPASEGEQVVYLERSSSNVGFHVVATGTVNASSQYQISYTFNRPGVYVMRIKVPGDGRLRASTSAPFTVTAAN
jgi:hypothetical protein